MLRKFDLDGFPALQHALLQAKAKWQPALLARTGTEVCWIFCHFELNTIWSHLVISSLVSRLNFTNSYFHEKNNRSSKVMIDFFLVKILGEKCPFENYHVFFAINSCAFLVKSPWIFRSFQRNQDRVHVLEGAAPWIENWTCFHIYIYTYSVFVYICVWVIYVYVIYM